MDKKSKSGKYNSPKGLDINGIKSEFAPASNYDGFPIQMDRCCPDIFGNTKDELHGSHLEISGYGLPHYSEIRKCMEIKKNEMEKINLEMKKNNLNPEEMYDSKYKKRKYKSKHANLGDDVIGYRLISKKEK